MKSKTTMALGCVAILLVLVFNLGILAQQDAPTDALQRVGMVSVMAVIQQCQANRDFLVAINAEQDKIIREQTQADQDLKSEVQVLNTLLQGTKDHDAQLKLVINKQATLQGQAEYYKQYFQVKDMKWKNELYQKILAAVNAVAEAKGLTMVFERTEPQFPIKAEQFAVTVSTHKLIYGKGCLDITSDVIAEIDK